MCGRYAITLPPDAMVQLFDAVWNEAVPNLAPRYNVAPTTPVPVMAKGREGRKLLMMRWGLVPSWSKDPLKGPPLFNARSETVAEKPTFRAAYKRMRRCLVPADGFYEWETDAQTGRKQPWFVRRAEGDVMVFAGLWDLWEGADGALLSCTILTTEANAPLAAVHDRCPVILERVDWPRWLEEDDPRDLFAPKPHGLLAMHKVSPRVGNVRNDDAQLIEAVA